MIRSVMLDIKVTQGSFWKGSQIPYWLFICMTVFGGLFGLDHLLLRSPLTALLKFLSMPLLLGFWYFYDIAQAVGEREFVEKFGISVPFYGPTGIAAGIFSGSKEFPPAPNEIPGPWKYFAYAIVTCVFFMLPVNKFVIGDYLGGILHILLYILFPLTFIAIAWTFYDIFSVLLNTKGIFEKGVPHMPPASSLIGPYFRRNALGPFAPEPPPPPSWFQRFFSAWSEVPISSAKVVSKSIDASSDATIGTVQSATEGVHAVMDASTAGIRGVGEGIEAATSGVGKTINAVGDTAKGVGDGIQAATSGVGKTINAVGDTAQSVSGALNTGVKGLTTGIGPAIQGVTDATKVAATGVVDATTGVASAATDVVLGEVKDKLHEATSAASNVIQGTKVASETAVQSSVGAVAQGAKAAESTLSLMAKVPEIGAKVADEMSDTNKLLEAAKKGAAVAEVSGTPNTMQGGALALLSDMPSVSTSVLLFSVALVAFSGYVFYTMRNTYKKPEKSDDPPRKPATVRSPSKPSE